MSDELPHSISEGKRMVAQLQKRNEELRAALKRSQACLKDISGNWLSRSWVRRVARESLAHIEKILEGE